MLLHKGPFVVMNVDRRCVEVFSLQEDCVQDIIIKSCRNAISSIKKTLTHESQKQIPKTHIIASTCKKSKVSPLMC